MAAAAQAAEQDGQAGDDRLLLMAALLVADELWDAKGRLAAYESGGAEVGRGGKPQQKAAKRHETAAAASSQGPPPLPEERRNKPLTNEDYRELADAAIPEGEGRTREAGALLRTFFEFQSILQYASTDFAAA